VNNTRYFHALGTDNYIYVPECADEKIVHIAEKKVLQLDDKLSIFKTESEISLVNQYAGKHPVRVSSDTMDILKRGLYWSHRTDGAFDITLGPLIALWRKAKLRKAPPECKSITDSLKLTNYKDLILDENSSTAMLRRSGQSLDLGGIAKGFAADQVKVILLDNDVKSALINLGGNIVAIGRRPDGRPWRLGIQKPFAAVGEYIGTALAQDCTVVTSGLYENHFIYNNRMYHHILDSITGWPCESGLLSITAIGECSMDMDALTTVIYTQGLKKGTELLKTYGSNGIFITSEKQVYVTDEIADKFELIKNRK
jgi:thiamine biosynthesis lipoprotein